MKGINVKRSQVTSALMQLVTGSSAVPTARVTDTLCYWPFAFVALVSSHFILYSVKHPSEKTVMRRDSMMG